MKKLVFVLIALMAVSAQALDNIALPTGGAFYDGKTLQPQRDTGTTTTTTDYTPRFYGDLLIGKTDSSNSIWFQLFSFWPPDLEPRTGWNPSLPGKRPVSGQGGSGSTRTVAKMRMADLVCGRIDYGGLGGHHNQRRSFRCR